MFFHTDAEALSNIECRAREKTLDSVLNEIKNMEKEYYLAQHNYKIYYLKKDQRYRTYVKNDDEKRKPLTSTTLEGLEKNWEYFIRKEKKRKF